MYKTNLYLLVVLIGVVLMGAGCVKPNANTNADTVVAPTESRPSSEPASGSLPTSAPAASSMSEPVSKPVDTAPVKSEPSTAPDQPTQSAPVPTPKPTPASTPAPEPKRVSAAMAGFSFQPNIITISVGDTITWTNNDGAPHTVTADNGSFDSGAISSGQTFSRTFTTAGTFSYSCLFHGSMHGTVVVK